MKNLKLLTLFMAMMFFWSCGQSTATSENNPSGTAKSGTIANTPLHITKAEFLTKVFDFEKNKDWNFQGDLPCIIDFYADWCRPCKMIGPYMEDIAKDYAGKIRVYKINIDEEKELAKAFNIESIPAVLFIPMKGQPQISVGALAKEEYVKMVNTQLLSPVK